MARYQVYTLRLIPIPLTKTLEGKCNVKKKQGPGYRRSTTNRGK